MLLSFIGGMEWEVTSPALMLLGIVITAVLAILGTLFGQRLLRKHFQKAGIVG